MKLRFLCAGHRQWLSSSPGQAVECWSNGLETGKIYCDQHQWQEALPYVGCAYEASEIMLSTTYLDKYNSVYFFTSSAVLLMEVLSRLNCHDESRQVYQSATQRLGRELIIHGADRPHVNQQLKRLDSELERLTIANGHVHAASAKEIPQFSTTVH